MNQRNNRAAAAALLGIAAGLLALGIWLNDPASSVMLAAGGVISALAVLLDQARPASGRCDRRVGARR